MNRFVPQHFDRLKKEVLDKCNISRLSPSDCKHISDNLFKHTNKHISETTLKRLFGFAYSTFNPSSFTLNTLADYCGYDGWDDFCFKSLIKERKNESADEQADKILVNAERITNNTLQVLKARSGIPFNKTISRKAFERHIKTFVNGDYNATVLTAPADHGKTIALCHWVNQLIEQNIQKQKKDIVLFFNHSVLQNPTVFSHNLNDWVRILLGIYDDEDFSSLFKSDRKYGNIYFIIDGVDDYKQRNDGYDLLNQIVDVVSLYKEAPWMKIVLSMRSYVWSNSRHKVAIEGQKWFTGFATNDKGDINLPLLSPDEVLEIADNLSFEKQKPIPKEMFYHFSYPLSIQYLYQSDPAKFSLNNTSELTIFEAVSSYFLHRIFRSRYNQDAMILLLKLIDHLDLNDDEFVIPREKINSVLKEYHLSYQEMLSNGILQEYNLSDGTGYINHIKISYKVIVTRLYARKLINENDGQFDIKLIQNYNNIPQTFTLKQDILKWFIYITVTGGKSCDLSLLDEAHLTICEKSQIIIFYADLISKYAGLNENKDLEHSLEHNADSLVGLEYIHKGYEQALNTLLNVKQFESYYLSIRICLGVISVLQLDLKKLEKQINSLRNLDTEPFLEYPINPLYCLETIYSYIKYGTVEVEALRMITKFYFNPQDLGKIIPKGFKEILYLLGFYTLQICNNDLKSMRYIKVLKRIYPEGSGGYQFLLKTMNAETLLNMGKEKEANELYLDITKQYRSAPNNFTSFMKVSYYSLRVKIENLDTCPKSEQINALIQLCDDSLYKLTKVRSLAFFLNNLSIREESIYDKFYLDILKTTTVNGCRAESFVNQ